MELIPDSSIPVRGDLENQLLVQWTLLFTAKTSHFLTFGIRQDTGQRENYPHHTCCLLSGLPYMTSAQKGRGVG